MDQDETQEGLPRLPVDSHAFSQYLKPYSRSALQLGQRASCMERLISRAQKLTAFVMAAFLIVVVLLSTAHLGLLIVEEVWKPPRFFIPVQGLLEIFGYFLLVLIGVELLETLKAYLRKDTIHVRVVLEMALIAMARKVIIEEPNTVSSLTLFGIAALILSLGIAFYFERQARGTSKDSEMIGFENPLSD
jgi:uncharacterized membrane protein (DUF373 family)